MVDLSVKIGSVALKNPIMPASGAFSTDLAQVMDINRLGALVAEAREVTDGMFRAAAVSTPLITPWAMRLRTITA